MWRRRSLIGGSFSSMTEVQCFYHSDSELLYGGKRLKHGSTYRQSCGIRYREREKIGRGESVAACFKIASQPQTNQSKYNVKQNVNKCFAVHE